MKARNTRRSLGLLSLAWTAVSALSGQEPPVFRSDVRLVTVPCSVTDARGFKVPNLERADFRLYDDAAPRQISALWHESDLPLTLGIIIDMSASQRDLAASHRAAVNRFLERFIRRGDRAFVVTVDANVILRSEVTGGANGLRQMLLSPIGTPLGVQCGTFADGRAICGGTALRNAIYASAVRLRPFSGSKALIVLTDGADTGSTHTAAAAAEAAQLANAAVYAIQYPEAASGMFQANDLAALTLSTGGALLTDSKGDPDELLKQIETDLRDRYILGFYAPASASDGKPHAIRVEAVPPGLVVRARTQYFRDTIE